MNGQKYINTHNRILEQGKKHIMKYGYMQSSLRELCKDAHVTTGCFYRHFESKDDLFEELVKPLTESLLNVFIKTENDFFGEVNENNAHEVIHKYVTILTDIIINSIFNYNDEFKLLLYKSEGSKYATFIDDIIKNEDKHVNRELNIFRKLGYKVKNIGENEIHMINVALFQGIFQIVENDWSLERSKEYLNTIFHFFELGWIDIYTNGN